MECQSYSCYYLVFLAGLLCYCVIASDWPEGYYGLPMANTGCPSGATFDWKSGWIYQDTENDNPRNAKSGSFHLEGQVRPSSVNRSFCMKTQIMNDHRRPYWPPGTYCIHQKTNDCPLGFKPGFITWDDEEDNNENQENGALPKLVLHSHQYETTIYFCCRNDRFQSFPINLPTGSPFYLFAHKSVSCQQVKWAVATSEWIEYRTEGYNDLVQNPAPFVQTERWDGRIKIYYCYYTSCQYTLNASSGHGMIQFPLHSGNYANGQLCSWRITVQPSQTIQVHFSRFRLSGDVNDQLIFYDGKDDFAPRLATLRGNNTEGDITSRVRPIQSSSSNLFVVFQSDRVNTASGFQASYNAIGTPLTFPPPISSTTKATIRRTTTGATTTGATTTGATTTGAAATTRETTTRETTKTQVASEKTNPTEMSLSSSNPPSKSSSEPSLLPERNSSKTYDAFKKTCVEQSQSTLTAVAIVIPLICLIAVIAMAGYLFFRLRKLHDKPSDVSVGHTTTESVNNPVYVPSDTVMEARPPSTNNAYEDSKGDIYHEIEASRQTTDNPLYQSADEEKHVYASFA